MLHAFILLVTVGNLALGFGLAVHFGFGPDLGWLVARAYAMAAHLGRGNRSSPRP